MTFAAFAALATMLVAVPGPGAADADAQLGGRKDKGDQESSGLVVGLASLPAATFAEGPPSGSRLGSEPRNGHPVPFDSQPVQGFSGIADADDGTFWVLSDNGFGAIANSPDYNLRLYRIRPSFKTAAKGKDKGKGSKLPQHLEKGDGGIEVLEHVELSDPDHKVPFPIVNHFSEDRVLTGADFDPESIQFARDGSLWIGDEFGPFLLHTDASGKLLEAPISLPNLDGEGGELRAPQNPYNEEIATLRTMNALRAHAASQGAVTDVVVSPWHVMLADDDPATFVEDREEPPSGEQAASSEIHDVEQLHNGGYKVVPYTINDPERMAELLELDVDGMISDRPDVLYDVIAAHDADGDGTAGDWILPDGRIDARQVDAQGHRGARNLRPENTLPAMEAALDELMTTLETDTGVTADGVAMLDHDPYIQSDKCRHADGSPYETEDEALIQDLTAAEIQSTFICDGLIQEGQPQTNDPALSPVTAAFVAEQDLDDLYVMPTLDQLFAFVDFYAEWYTSGPGAAEPDAEVKAANAAEVRFNVETKRNPRPEAVDRTVGPEEFVEAVAGSITAAGLTERADVQSFDWSTLLEAHRTHPDIRTVALLGDFSTAAGDDGTNLEPDDSEQTPWLGGLTWPYRVTERTHPFDVQSTGGFEGTAQSPDGRTLYPMLEKPLPGDGNSLRIFELDVRTASYTGTSWTYSFDDRGEAIGDFVLFGKDKGLVIERDATEGDLDGFKAVYEIELPRGGGEVTKTQVVDLLDIANPAAISLPGNDGDVGVGDPFAFPFVTIEDVVVLDRHTIGVLNDNNYPNSVGRHVGSGEPDDNEFVVIRLDRPLAGAGRHASGR